MYATAIDLERPADSTHARDEQFRRPLSAVYTARGPALRRLADAARPNGADPWDLLQDAFLHVLEHPPIDTSALAVGAALERAVRVATNRESTRRREDSAMRVALRKRSV